MYNCSDLNRSDRQMSQNQSLMIKIRIYNQGGYTIKEDWYVNLHITCIYIQNIYTQQKDIGHKYSIRLQQQTTAIRIYAKVFLITDTKLLSEGYLVTIQQIWALSYSTIKHLKYLGTQKTWHISPFPWTCTEGRECPTIEDVIDVLINRKEDFLFLNFVWWKFPLSAYVGSLEFFRTHQFKPYRATLFRHFISYILP